MQIALVAVVLLAGMWFTVLKPKPADDTSAASAPAAVAPGTTGLSNAVDKAKAVSKASDATNAKIQSATGGNAPAATKAKATTAKKAAATKTSAAKAKVTKSTAAKKATTTAAATKATAKPAAAKATTTTGAAATTATKAKAVDVDPSARLLAFLAKGKTLVVLFEGKGVDDKAARTAVHNTAKGDPKHVVSAYVPITRVGDYDALTSDINIFQAPSILVIGADRKAKLLTGYVDTRSVQQAVGDARRDAAAAAKSSK